MNRHTYQEVGAGILVYVITIKLNAAHGVVFRPLAYIFSLNAFTHENPLLTTLSISIGRSFGALKGLKSVVWARYTYIQISEKWQDSE